MINTIDDFQKPFFIGIAGSGMSAIAQYLQGKGKSVSGSDRFFVPGETNEIRNLLEKDGIKCFFQNGEGITDQTDLIVVSSAIEDTVVEVQKAKRMGIPIIRRSELLAIIAKSKRTIAVGGTSGKSTTTAMLYDILAFAGKEPSIIAGAGLVSIIKEGRIGNARVGKGEWLIIEADESDGSIVQYSPEIGLLLNIDKDHKEIDALLEVFDVFKKNSKFFVVNQSHPLASKFSQDLKNDFSTDDAPAGYQAGNFSQKGLHISFTINEVPFFLELIGKHNMENAIAASAVAAMTGVKLETSSKALERYEGIYRRNQLLGKKNGITVIDDYAHNPVKCAAAITACQPIASKVVAWFQPHGYGPTKFLRNDFVNEISKVLRPGDEIWMSEIFYAGGTTTKDISAADLINDLKNKDCAAFFVEDREKLVASVRSHLTNDSVLLLMGARDPSLETFSRSVYEAL